nr:transposase [Accumulibacter sp.]
MPAKAGASRRWQSPALNPCAGLGGGHGPASDRTVALIPPPRRHRHRYYGVLAPNAPLRAQVHACRRARESDRAACYSD